MASAEMARLAFRQALTTVIHPLGVITDVIEPRNTALEVFSQPNHTGWMRTAIATRCLCCGFKTLAVPEALELCQVCWWQDDGQDDRDADQVRRTVNGSLSLSEGRRNYQHLHAADPRFVTQVRVPRPDEI